METYDLTYPGAAIDAILNTAYYLQEAGFIFRGSASDYADTPSKREWVIAPAGFTGYGISSPVPKGSIGICLYNGTAWVGKIINVVSIDSSVNGSSTNPVSGSAVYSAINQLATGVAEALDNLTFTDTTPSADQDDQIKLKVSTTDAGVERILTYITLLTATTSKAGLMSAEDKAKVDSFLNNLRSLTFADTTASADQATQITETLKATIGGVQEVIDSITILAATSSKAGLLSASDKAYIDALPSALTNLSNSISAALALMESLVGYYVCDTAAATAAKTVAATGYTLTNGGCIRIKMTNANTAANVSLNINSTGAKALYYDGAQASSTNTWEAGEVLEVYYDGENYQCVSSGGGRAARVKYDNSSSGLDADNVQEAIDIISSELYTESEVSLGSSISMLINDSLKWYSGENGTHYLIPASSGESYRITANDNNNATYIWLTSNAAPVSNANAPVSAIDGTKHVVTNGEDAVAVCPSDAHYLYLLGNYSNVTFTPSSVKKQVPIKDKIDQNAADIDQLEDDVNIINGTLQGTQEIELGWTANYAVKASDGTTPSVSGNNYSINNEWVDISSFTNITFDLLQASPIYGVALYDSSKAFLRGWVGNGSVWAYTRMTVPVNGATYIRITGAGPNHSSIGNPKLFGVEPNTTRFLDKESVANSLDVTEEGKVLDARQGKILSDLVKNGTYEVLDFGWTNGSGIKYMDGTLYTDGIVATVVKYSDYIDIKGFNVLTTKLIGGSSTFGIAFYNSSKTYISGVVSSQSTAGYDQQTIDIPTGAEYVRITGYQDETTYGQQIMVLGKSADSDLIEVPLSFFFSDPVGGWWRIPSGQFVSATNYATNRTFVEKGSDMIISGDEGYMLMVVGMRSGLTMQIDANGNPTSQMQQYSSLKRIKAGYEWNVQLRYSVLADITDYNEIVSHFTVRMSMADFLTMMEGETRDMKMANPYYDTFASFNETASTQLVKETIFGTTIDGGGGSTRRIPSVILTNSGKVIAATEVRSSYDDNAQTGIIVARKALDGDTWTYNLVLPYSAATYGKVMNPSFVVDRTGAHGTAGRVYLFFLAFPITSTNHGYAKDATTAEMDCMYIYSDNDGETWSSPVSVKSGWDTTEWTWLGVSPSNGVQMSDGTIAFPCMGRYNSQWYSGVMWKTPSGSWQFSKRSEFTNDNESCIFVYEGNIYLNCRNEDTGNTRTLYKLNTSDGVLSSVPYKYDPNVICQQSICQGTIDGATIYIQTANDPIVYNTRNRLTLFVSPDGMQWYRMIRVNDATTYGYSVADTYNGSLVIVYENSGTISYINLTPVVPAIDTTHDRAFGKNEEERMQEIVERFIL